MSVATIVKGNEFPEFKEYLKTYSPPKKKFTSSTGYPPFSKDIPVKVPSINITSHESGNIGELADFLFCLEIARYVEINKELIFDSLTWRARQLFDGCIRINRSDENNKKHCDLFDRAIEACHKYALGGSVDLTELVSQSNILNKAEHYLHYTKFKSREEFSDYFLLPCPTHIVDDVVKLVSVFRESFISSGIIKKDSIVVCHPWFGTPELGESIADLYLDGVLYDFKSTKKTGYSWEDVGQVYGYYILYRLHPNDYLELPIPITHVKSIALYYSRLGDIEMCDLSESNAVLPESEIEYIANLIHEHSDERYHEMNERRLEDIAEKIILKEMHLRKTNKVNISHTPKTVGYNVGDVIYAYSHGKGTVLRFERTNDTWKVVIGFESGRIMEGDINLAYLLNWNSGEILEWRRIFDRLHQTNWSDSDAVSELADKYRELASIHR